MIGLNVRTIILHYHLFKNAGTSLDAVLKQNFGSRWVTKEFKGTNNTEQVEDWIKTTPDAVAFSSHTLMGPLPQIDGVRIVSVMLLRDPIARIKSAYSFERKQVADTFGAVLAKHTTLEGYVKTRLSLANDRQCRNFQTSRLASLVQDTGPELPRAQKALAKISVAGLVSDFSGALFRLEQAIADDHPDFTWTEERQNVSSRKRLATDKDLDALLRQVNADDLAVVDFLTLHLTSSPAPHKAAK